jgi:hypothetical protein
VLRAALDGGTGTAARHVAVVDAGDAVELIKVSEVISQDFATTPHARPTDPTYAKPAYALDDLSGLVARDDSIVV